MWKSRFMLLPSACRSCELTLNCFILSIRLCSRINNSRPDRSTVTAPPSPPLPHSTGSLKSSVPSLLVACLHQSSLPSLKISSCHVVQPGHQYPELHHPTLQPIELECIILSFHRFQPSTLYSCK